MRLMVASLTPVPGRSFVVAAVLDDLVREARCSTTGTGLCRAASSCTGESVGSAAAGRFVSGSGSSGATWPTGTPSSTPVRAWPRGSTTGSTVPVRPSPGCRVVSVTVSPSRSLRA